MSKTALPGKRGNFAWLDESDIRLVTNPSDVLYDPRVNTPPPAEFVANIDQFGVQEPILVAKRNGSIDVVAGRKRVLAVKIVNERFRKDDNKVTIPAILVKGDDAYLKTIMILENEVRVAETPSGKALKTASYLELVGGDQEQVAVTFGVTKKTVQARIKFMKLAPTVQKMVDEGSLGFWTATELSELTAEEQEMKAAEIAAGATEEGRKPNVEDAKRAAGKGRAREREKKATALAALKEAAHDYGQARMEETGIREAQTKLGEAALAYCYAMEKPS